MPLIVPGGTLEQARLLAPRLRPADKLEVFRASGMTPLEGLEFSLTGTLNTFCLIHDGQVEAMGGCSPLPSDPRVGAPWMLGTDFMVRHRVWFLRNTPAIWNTMGQTYEYFWNLVDAQNHVHVRWLEWSGCKFPARRMLNGHPFMEFVKKCASPSQQ